MAENIKISHWILIGIVGYLLINSYIQNLKIEKLRTHTNALIDWASSDVQLEQKK